MTELVRWHGVEPKEAPAVMSYFLNNAESRRSLVADLQEAVIATIGETVRACKAAGGVLLIDDLMESRRRLLEAIGEIDAEDQASFVDASVLYLRYRQIEDAITKLIDCLAEMPTAVNRRGGGVWGGGVWSGRGIISSMKKAATRFNHAIHKPIGISELSRSGELIEHLKKMIDEKGGIVVSIDTTRLHPEVAKCFGVVQRQASVEEAEKTTTDLLASLSPDLLAAYTKTRDLARKVQTMDGIAPEDHLFIEQVGKEYFPEMFKALQKASVRAADSPHWKKVVQECITQFELIQTGLQKAVEGTLRREVAAMQSQTQLLRDKVLGNAGSRLELIPAKTPTTHHDALKDEVK